jgi:hypothetical protein
MHTEPENPAFTTTISGTHGETLTVTDDFERHGLLDGELLVRVLGPKGGCKYLFTISRDELARLSQHPGSLGALRNRVAHGSCGPRPCANPDWANRCQEPRVTPATGWRAAGETGRPSYRRPGSAGRRTFR